jgi:hypothetical protein
MADTPGDYVIAAPTPEEIIERKATRALNERALQTIFTEARTANGFIDRKFHMNCWPARSNLRYLVQPAPTCSRCAWYSLSPRKRKPSSNRL